jgi:hypothetical protein
MVRECRQRPFAKGPSSRCRGVKVPERRARQGRRGSVPALRSRFRRGSTRPTPCALPLSRYLFVVGWSDEPTFTGAKNAVGLNISDFQTEEPITEKIPVELEVEVIFEDESSGPLTMEPSFSDPSFFEATIAPTRPGEYTFHFTGTVGDLEVDEEFTSGPDTFNSPQELREIQFPVQDPTTAELAERIDQELPRVQEEAVAAAQNATESASDDVDAARTIAFIALGLGVIAVILGIVAVARPRGPRGAVSSAAPSESKSEEIRA